MASLEAAAAQLRARIQTIQDKYRAEEFENKEFRLDKLLEVLGDENRPPKASGCAKAPLRSRMPDNGAEAAGVEAGGPKISDVVNKLRREHERVLATKQAEFREALEHAEKRHIDRLDTLITEKRELTEALDEMAKKLRTSQHELGAVESRHKQHITSLKQKLEEQQRQSRLLWEKEKLVEIKELTLRSLEPEVNKIMEKKDHEIADLHNAYSKRIETLTGELAAANVKFLTELETLSNEKANSQAASILELERKSVQDAHCRELAALHHKLHAEFTVQLQEAETRATAAEKELGFLKAEFTRELDMERRRLNLEADVDMAKAREALRLETEQLRLKLAQVKDETLAAAEIQLKLEYEAKLAETRSTLKAERDAKLREVVEKLSLDSVESEQRIRVEARTEFEKERSRLRAELADLHGEVSKLTIFSNELSDALAEARTDNNSLQSELRSARFGNEKLQEALRKERFSDTEEKRRLNGIAEQAAAEREQLLAEVEGVQATLKRRVEAEEEVIAVIEARLKSVLQEKDESIAELNSENELWQAKCQHLERLVNQQRQDLLAHLQ